MHFSKQKGRLVNKRRAACGQMISRCEAPNFAGLSRDVDFERLVWLHFVTTLKNSSPGSANSSMDWPRSDCGASRVRSTAPGRACWPGNSTATTWSRTWRRSRSWPQPAAGRRPRPVRGRAVVTTVHRRSARTNSGAPRLPGAPAADQEDRSATGTAAMPVLPPCSGNQ